MSNCKVWIDNYNGPFFPGSLIQGKFVITLDSETTLRSVKVRIIGSEHTEWLGQTTVTNPTDNSTKHETVNFIGDNDFLFHEVILYGNSSGSTTLAMGQHVYPFSYTLPFNLPSTYNCPKGSIFYKITGIVDRPMRTDYEDQFLFVVNAPIDLNRIEQTPELMGPSEYGDEKQVCCFCCASGPISMDITMARLAAIPGEKIPIAIRVSNQSNVNVESVKIVLKEETSYIVNHPNNQEEEVTKEIATAIGTGVGAHAENTYTDLDLIIPQDIFLPNFDQCKLFKVTYKYEVRCVLPSYHKDLVIKIKPKIGNIPPGGSYQGPPPTGPPQGYPQGPQGYPQGPSQGGYTPGPYPSQEPTKEGYPVSPGGYPSAPINPVAPSAPGPLGPPPPGGYPTSNELAGMGFIQTGPGGYPMLPNNSDAPPSYDSVKPH